MTPTYAETTARKDHVRATEPTAGSALLRPQREIAPHDMNAPIFERIDIIGLALGIVITLGPLAAYAFGFGL